MEGRHHHGQPNSIHDHFHPATNVLGGNRLPVVGGDGDSGWLDNVEHSQILEDR